MSDFIMLSNPTSLSVSGESSSLLTSSSLDYLSMSDDIKLSDFTGVSEDDSTTSTASGSSDKQS
jgi:hypothetical protein